MNYQNWLALVGIIGVAVTGALKYDDLRDRVNALEDNKKKVTDPNLNGLENAGFLWGKVAVNGTSADKFGSFESRKVGDGHYQIIFKDNHKYTKPPTVLATPTRKDIYLASKGLDVTNEQLSITLVWSDNTPRDGEFSFLVLPTP